MYYTCCCCCWWWTWTKCRLFYQQGWHFILYIGPQSTPPPAPALPAHSTCVLTQFRLACTQKRILLINNVSPQYRTAMTKEEGVKCDRKQSRKTPPTRDTVVTGKLINNCCHTESSQSVDSLNSSSNSNDSRCPLNAPFAQAHNQIQNSLWEGISRKK